jgi:hypothetical protein
MRDFLASRKPSPAMAVAFVALLAALSGTAIALPGTNSVDSGDIVNNTVRGKDIRNGSVGGKDIKNGSVKSLDVGDDSLTGTDINEGTLGKVPSAANADHATNADSATNATNATNATTAQTANTLAPNMELRAFNIGGTNVTTQTVLNLDGLVLKGGCTSGTPNFSAETTVNDARLWSVSINTPTPTGTINNEANNVDPNFDIGEVEDLLPDSTPNQVGFLRYVRQPGEPVVTVDWATTNNLNGGCLVAGTATSG